jgi:D-methionine transport system permease protein
LTFVGSSTTEPVLSRACSKFDLDFNILLGQVDEIQSESYGTLTIVMEGTTENFRQALNYIAERGFASRSSQMSSNIINLLWESFLETILMVGVSGGLGAAIGIPLGVFLFVTSPKGIMPKPYVNRIIGTIVNAVRSTPFIILLVAIIPFTRLIVGSSIGTVAAIVPLTIAAAPLIARLVETSLREVDKGLIEAAQSMGATNTQIICKVLLPEAMPGILAGLTIAFVALVGSSAMAGAVGGGGLGDMGIRYGYQRFMPEVMAAVVIILIVFVQSLQSFGDWMVRRVSHR